MHPIKTRKIVGEYAIDLYPANGRFYYTVTRSGSADLLSIGDQPTMELALKQAEWIIDEFGERAERAEESA